MKYNKNIHSKGVLTKSVVGNFLNKINYHPSYNNGDLLVLAYHNTPKHTIRNFERQLLIIKEHFQFLTPKELPNVYSKTKYDRPLVLLTFDDGIASNKYAVDVMNKHGIKGIFFAVPEFIKKNRAGKENPHFLKLYCEPKEEMFPSLEDRTAMNWEELRELVSIGHMIGSHSYSHVLRANTPSSMLHKEIIESKHVINDNVYGGKNKTTSFCGPVNSLLSINKDSMKLIKKNYDYFFSTFPGINTNKTNPHFIYRTTVESSWPSNCIYYLMTSYERNRMKKQKGEFRTIILAE